MLIILLRLFGAMSRLSAKQYRCIRSNSVHLASDMPNRIPAITARAYLRNRTDGMHSDISPFYCVRVHSCH